MQHLGPGQLYSDHTASSHYHHVHVSRERNDFSRMGQDYHVQQPERVTFDGRFVAESRGRPAAGVEFSSRGSEQPLSQALSSRSPARKCPDVTIMFLQHQRMPI
jgi:hypothetical protein